MALDNKYPFCIQDLCKAGWVAFDGKVVTCARGHQLEWDPPYLRTMLKDANDDTGGVAQDWTRGIK